MRSGKSSSCGHLHVVDCRASSCTHIKPSAERLNLCLSGKELSSMFLLSLFLVTCAECHVNVFRELRWFSTCVCLHMFVCLFLMCLSVVCETIWSATLLPSGF